MIHTIDDYCFDSERMIFYSKDIPIEVVREINSACSKDDNYIELRKELLKIDADHLSADRILPVTAGICLTYKCQLNCNYCSFDSQIHGKELDIDAIRVFVNFLIKNVLIRKIANEECSLTLYFTGGGEPTQNWKLFYDTVEYIKTKCAEKGIRYYLHLTTNGLLNEKQIDYISCNFSSVMVSFDGTVSIQNNNRPVRGNKRSSDIVMKTLSSFNSRKAPFTIRTTIWQHDFSKINEMADVIYGCFGNNLGWSISPILVTGRAAENTNDEYFDASKFNFIEYFISASKYAKEKYGSHNMSIKLFPNSITDILCGSCFIANPWLMPDRTISTCLEAKNNIPTIGFVDGNRVVLFPDYEDKLLKEYRKRFVSKDCTNCIAFRFCRSGCPLKFLEEIENDNRASNWICEMTRFYWKYVFKSVLRGETVFGWYVQPVENDFCNKYNILQLKKRS